MKFRLELRDKSFNIKEILDDEFIELGWSYSAIGGCGEFGFMLPRRRFGERALTGESNVRIYYRNPSTEAYELWYQGLINNKAPTVTGNSENIPVSGHGYVTQLDRIYLNDVSFASTEASVIITALLDDYILENTDITYDPSDIEVTSFSFDNIKFNDTVQSAIEKIAETVGALEWGVDRNRKFFFKARSETTGFRFVGGKNITSFRDNQDFDKIVNQYYVQGAQVGGTYFTFGPYNDTSSQTKYNLRTQILQNSSVSTEAVASQLAQARLDKFGEVSRRASGDLVGFNALLESTTPISLLAEIGRKWKYGQKKYGEILYQGIVSRQVSRVNYRLSNNGTLSMSVELGILNPKTAEIISQLEYDLDQQRSASL